MRRRTVLASLGSTLGIAATAGCLGSAAPDTDDEGDDPTDSPTSDPTTQEPTSPDPAATGSNSASDSTTAFAGVGCPSFTDRADRTVCSNTADLDSVPVSLVPGEPVFEPTTGDDSVETLTVTLDNHSDDSFGFNPYAWTLYRHGGDESEWTRVAPDGWPEPWTTLDAGQRYTYKLSVETHPSPRAEDQMAIQEDLDSGVYALAIDGDLSGERIECVAVFAVEREN